MEYSTQLAENEIAAFLEEAKNSNIVVGFSTADDLRAGTAEALAASRNKALYLPNCKVLAYENVYVCMYV